MKQEIADQWVATLRSGNYQQGFGALRSTDKFCVLGVLCNIYSQSCSEDQWVEDRILGKVCSLPKPIMDWAGMKSTNGILPDSNTSLTYLNDHDVPFTELADVIEHDIELL